MQYLGGKSKISKEIASLINNVLTALGGGYMRYLGVKSRISTQLSNVVNTTFLCLDYKDVEIPQGAIVYADPPYDNTTGYSLGNFDSNEFWDYARKLSETNIILISEEKAPDDFVSIWHKEQKRMIDNVNKNIFTRTENLFVHNKYKNII